MSRSLLTTTVLVLIGFGSARAATIASVSGAPAIFGVSDSQHGTVNWTTPAAYTNVAIQARLTGDGAAPITAYLMSQIGPGTTLSHQLATSTLVPTGINDWLTLFTGLTLNAGTHYLVLSGTPNLSTGWAVATDPQVIQLAAGVTTASYIANAASGGVSLYPPAGTFGTLNLTPWQFAVTGDPVPEPAMGTLCGVLLVVGILWRHAVTRTAR